MLQLLLVMLSSLIFQKLGLILKPGNLLVFNGTEFAL